jgi:hypothetical protein
MKVTDIMSLWMRMHKAQSLRNIYKITGSREDYINPTTNGYLSWRSVKSYDTNSEEAMERWKNKLYEVFTRRCAHMSVEERKEEIGPYCYDGSELVDTFITWIQHIPEHQRPCTLDTILIGIISQWWDAHQE